MGRHHESSEGVVIFTVKHEGASPLIRSTLNVRTTFGRVGLALGLLPALMAASPAVSGAQTSASETQNAPAPATPAQTTPTIPATSSVFQTPPQPGAETLCQPQVVGNRRIPKESVLARLFSHQGDVFDPVVVERDFNSLWNTGYFDDVRVERQDTATCVQLIVFVREKPTIKDINYKGINAISQSDILDRFKKEKVGLTVESQYDPTRVKRAEVVLREMLSEHGHQYATVRTEIKTIPPAGVSLTFSVKEGPTVKVGKIAFQGNNSINDRTLRAAMKNLKPIGVPHSVILEDLFARTYDATKLDEDTERVRQVYRERGYFKALMGDPTTHIRDVGGINPFTLRPSQGKRVDILMPVEEGERYKLGGIKFTGTKAVTNLRVLRAQFTQKDGEYFNATLFSKGLDQLRKAYGSLGYINMVPTPSPVFDEAKKAVTWNIDIDEGKQFFVSRIEFTGNNITRDKVIRRELQLEEGQQYNSQAWDLSILRLNQLGYFDTLKADQDSESRLNNDDGTVDLLLKLKEKGKNSIGLNGGISGLSGTFIGLNYETNNFLGLGETLNLQANIGDLSRRVSFGFNEPYLRNKPVALGFQVFTQKFDYNPARSYTARGATAGNLTTAQQSLLTNYNQSTTGLTTTVSEPLRHLFAHTGVARVGLSYSLSRSSITTFNSNTRNVFQSLAFRSGVAGQNQLNGIVTSVLTPSFTYSSLDRAVGPHRGKDFNAALQIAGAGGNVKYYSPQLSYRQFYPMKLLKISPEGHNVLGYRVQLAHSSGFGGEVAPPQNRFYGGGETSIRGFDIRSASPYVFIPNNVAFNLTNPDGSTVPRDPTNIPLGAVTIPLPVYRLVSIGGDTSLTSNLEYRIPIVNQVTFAFFTDFDLTFDAQAGQLRQNAAGQSLITSPLYGCATVVNGACVGGQKVDFPYLLKTVPGTNFVPRMSNGAEVQVILPVVNAPFRIFYAYNPLRLYRNVPSSLGLPASCGSGGLGSGTVGTQCFRQFFPDTAAGDFTYAQALQLYGANYTLREPRKTFRLTVSTTF